MFQEYIMFFFHKNYNQDNFSQIMSMIHGKKIFLGFLFRILQVTFFSIQGTFFGDFFPGFR